jgi:Ca2+-binding EF-hand superfamily protein
LLAKHDSDHDGSLTYMEFENMLLELPVSFKSGIFNDILIGEMLDVGKRNSKISFDILKWFIGTGSAPQGYSIQD